MAFLVRFRNWRQQVFRKRLVKIGYGELRNSARCGPGFFRTVFGRKLAMANKRTRPIWEKLAAANRGWFGDLLPSLGPCLGTQPIQEKIEFLYTSRYIVADGFKTLTMLIG